MTGPDSLMGHILAQPGWLVAWVLWMMAVNLASVAWVATRVEARWVLLGFALAAGIMQVLFWAAGYVRLLGLAHVLAWTPLVVYLARRWPRLEPGAYRAWVGLVLATDVASLLIDYTDVLRYLLGG